MSELYEPVFEENKHLVNPIDEYIDKNFSQESTFQDLFEATEENVDLRTEVTLPELVIVTKLKVVDDFIKEKLKLKDSVYHNFINKYLRLRISTNRKSRIEFVDINKKDRFKDKLSEFGAFANLSKIKEA